jgi:hypothetical protein
VACSLSLAAGTAATVAGFFVQSTPEDRTPRPLAVGEAFVAPERVWLVGDLVVYGSPDERGRPDLDELGCVVTEGGGPLSVERAAQEDRVVVAEQGQVPLVSFPAGRATAWSAPALPRPPRHRCSSSPAPTRASWCRWPRTPPPHCSSRSARWAWSC